MTPNAEFTHIRSFPTLEGFGIALAVFSPMANGLLTGKYDKNSTFEAGTDYRNSMLQFRKEAFERNRELLELLNKTAAEKNAMPAQISMAWMICKKSWIIPIPGTRKEERLAENAGASDVDLSADEVKALDAALDRVPMSDAFGGPRVKR